jgi:hypothetical protein
MQEQCRRVWSRGEANGSDPADEDSGGVWADWAMKEKVVGEAAARIP